MEVTSPLPTPLVAVDITRWRLTLLGMPIVLAFAVCPHNLVSRERKIGMQSVYYTRLDYCIRCRRICPYGFAIAHDFHNITSGCCGRVRRSVLLWCSLKNFQPRSAALFSSTPLPARLALLVDFFCPVLFAPFP